MIYGDLQFIDIIIFAGVAIFLIYRIRKVLGKRTGFEKKTSIDNIVQKDPSNEFAEKKIIPVLKDNEEKLSKAYEVLKNFNHKQFLEDAKYAFETIINAFNKGDKKTLKNLLTKEVFLSFQDAIDKKQTNPEFQFYSLTINGVEDVGIEKNLIRITLRITSEQFKDNDESTIIKKQDIWTFQKNIDSNSPIWFLSST